MVLCLSPVADLKIYRRLCTWIKREGCVPSLGGRIVNASIKREKHGIETDTEQTEHSSYPG